MNELRLAKPYYGWLAASAACILISYIPLFLSATILDAFAREDAIFELLSPVYLIVAAGMFFVAWLRLRRLPGTHWLLRWALLGLAVLLVFAAGEEISWGQRIFGIETPDLIKGVNVQKELSVHNLKFFQGEDAVIPISAGQAASAFCLLFGFLIPLANLGLKRWQPKFELERLIPVVPLAFGLLMPLNYAIQKTLVRVLPHFPALYQHPDLGVYAAVHEIREYNYALALMICAIFYVIMCVGARNKPADGK